MKKSTIWIIAISMGISFLALLYLQAAYIDDVVWTRREQVVASIRRSLVASVHSSELAETQRGLEKSLSNSQRDSIRQDMDVRVDSMLSSQRKADTSGSAASTLGMGLIVRNNDALNLALNKTRQELRSRLESQKSLLNEVAYDLLYESSDKPLKERIDFEALDHLIKEELRINGVDLQYHFTVTTADGQEVYHCPDYEQPEKETVFTEKIFANDPPARVGYINVHFPEMRKYIYRSVRFIVPAIIFTFVLLVIFIFTIYSVYRQKRLTEMKNDFINNMTHEFKTPISSISLAAQMLNDPSVGKNEAMFQRLARIINDETKRLRFQVEKILQMSMFTRDSGTYKRRRVDVNVLVEDVASTFRLKVESSGGVIDTQLGAENPSVYVDQMHFTNVVFNLLDNAVKYRDAERQLQLKITTANVGEKVKITIQDNGIGIKSADLRKIFDRFYRVHTGNRHDVKGFGLGLAYVKNVIDYHKGTIYAESELGQGTKFIIILPLFREKTS